MTRALLLLCGLLPATLPAIELGGQEVPKERFIVFLLIGHSNSMGYGTKKDPHDKEGMKRIWYYSTPRKGPGGWVPSKEGVIEPTAHASPGHRFITHLAKAYPGYHFGFVQVSNPGTVIRFYLRGVDDQRSEAKEGEKLKPDPELRAPLEAAIAAVKDQATWGGALCFLGYPEGKAKYGMVDVANYKPNLIRIREQLRELTGVPDLPFILNQQELYAPEGREHSGKILGWMYDVVLNDAAARSLITPERPVPVEYFGDSWHYAVAGYEIWATYGARRYQDLGFDSWYKDGGRTLVEPVRIGERAEAPGQWPVDRTGLRFIWENGASARLLDPAGAFVRLCAVRPVGLARFTPSQGMLIDGGHFTMEDVAATFPESMKDPLGIMLSLRPFGPTAQPATIIEFADEKGPALRFEQHGLALRITTRVAEGSTSRLRTWRIGNLVPTTWTDLVVTSDLKMKIGFMNGKKAITWHDFQAEFDDVTDSVWKKYRLDIGKITKVSFGATSEGTLPWSGEMENIALYQRAFAGKSSEEVAANHAYCEAQRAKRAAIPRIRVQAKLRELPNMGQGLNKVVIDDTYPRLLAMARWEVEKVIDGDLKDKEVLVAHWARLDQKPVPAYEGLSVGATKVLELEDMALHPEVSGEQRVDMLEVDLSTPLLLDVGRLSR